MTLPCHGPHPNAVDLLEVSAYPMAEASERVSYLARAIRFCRRTGFAIRFFGRPIRVDSSSWVSSRSVIRVCAGGGTVSIGKNCEIHPYAMLLTYGGDIHIGDNCSVNPFTIIYGIAGAHIGNGVRIAAHTVIVPGNHNPGTPDVPLYRSGIRKQGICIGDNVWIGAGVRILDGVQIGSNSIIGAGSVVTRSFPANSTVAGVPARALGDRSSDGENSRL